MRVHGLAACSLGSPLLRASDDDLLDGQSAAPSSPLLGHVAQGECMSHTGCQPTTSRRGTESTQGRTGTDLDPSQHATHRCACRSRLRLQLPKPAHRQHLPCVGPAQRSTSASKSSPRPVIQPGVLITRGGSSCRTSLAPPSPPVPAVAPALAGCGVAATAAAAAAAERSAVVR